MYEKDNSTEFRSKQIIQLVVQRDNELMGKKESIKLRHMEELRSNII